MQKLASLSEVSAQLVLNADRAAHCQPYGAKSYPADAIKDDKPDKRKRERKRGGGGLARAFVSHLASTHRLANGKLDMTTIWQKHRAERAKPHSDILESLRDTARAAILASRQLYQQGRRQKVSAFGSVRNRHVRGQQKEVALRALQDSMPNPREQEDETAGLQMVPLSEAEADDMSRQLATHAGQGLQDQASMLRALSRLQAKDQRISEEKEEADLREHLQSGKDDLCDLDLSALGDDYSSVKTLRSGSILDVLCTEMHVRS